MSSLDSKKEQFSAFYLIAYPIKANIVDITQQQFSQSALEFEKHMPYAFKIAGEMADIQSKALKPLRGLGEKLEDLVAYLQFQTKKIDLMMSFILQQQDEPTNVTQKWEGRGRTGKDELVMCASKRVQFRGSL